jgi:hypothetical protein
MSLFCWFQIENKDHIDLTLLNSKAFNKKTT